MALNKYQLKHMAKNNHKGARKTLGLLGQIDRLLGTILLGNNLSNTAAAALVTTIAFKLFGENELSLTIATLVVTTALLIFSEITPKILGASYPEKIALPASYMLEPNSNNIRCSIWLHFTCLISRLHEFILQCHPLCG